MTAPDDMREKLAAVITEGSSRVDLVVARFIADRIIAECMQPIQREIAELRERNERDMTLGHNCGFNAAIILSEHRAKAVTEEHAAALAASKARVEVLEAALHPWAKRLDDLEQMIADRKLHDLLNQRRASISGRSSPRPSRP